MTRRDELRRIERKITRLAHISLGRTAARHRAELSGVDLSRPAIGILAALHTSGAVRLSTLSSLTHLEAPLVSREIRQLEQDGYVTRVADPDDGRAAIVESTALGHETFLRYRATTDSIIAETFADWNDADLTALGQALERLEAAFARAPTGRTARDARGSNGT
jgi:DNA-binding MarR family transcriptional regulator